MLHRVAGAPLDFAALRAELAVPGEFPADVSAEAERAAGSVALPDVDATDIPFVTIDPAGSRDLDQAVHIAADGDGYLVNYAIADVAAFVQAGGALDAEARRRGETLYFPDLRVPLHPPSLSEGAASLLPGQVRPAVLWRMALAADGTVRSVDVRRARMRSTAQLDYVGVQQALDRGTPPEPIRLLPQVGQLRRALARARHAVDIDIPEQLVERDATGGWTLAVRAQLVVEQDNAEISLLTGMAAAQIMLEGGVGILRTVPQPDDRAVAALRGAAAALGIAWPDGARPGDVLAGVDRNDPRHVAFVEHAAALLRGAAYTPFDGTAPEQTMHSGIGASYAHVTAPLRRLVDRFGTEVCLALHAGAPVPQWARTALTDLPATMAHADHLAHQADRAVVDAAEAWLLRDRVGETFAALVIDADEKAGTVVLDEPAVRARCAGAGLPVGQRITVRLAAADVDARIVRFERAGQTDNVPLSTVTA
jgi:VacB/RNase II family 3'-5' exoribonuclease